LAAPEIAERIRRLNDIFGAVGPYAMEQLSVDALSHISKIATRAKEILQNNRRALREFFDTRDDLEVVWSGIGTTLFPKLRSGNVEQLCALLVENYDTAVAPGRFFESPEHFRIGICCSPDAFRAGLDGLAQALDRLPV